MKITFLTAILALSGLCPQVAFAYASPPTAPRERAAATSTRTPTTAKESTELRQQARAALRAKDFDRAEKHLDAGRRIRIQAERDAWQLFECELALARGQAPRAGLAAMRMVILTPDSTQVGAAFFSAGRAYEAMERPAKAIELYRECAQHPSAPAGVRDQANARIKALSAKQPDKAGESTRADEATPAGSRKP